MISDSSVACMQALYVIDSIPQEQKEMIPQKVLDSLSSKAELNGDGYYVRFFDNSGNVILSPEAQTILVYLYKNYINKDKVIDDAIEEKLKRNAELKTKLKESANQKQISKLNIKENIFEKEDTSLDNSNEGNEAKEEKLEDRFKTAEVSSINDETKVETTELIIPKQNIFKRIINKIKSLFKK